MTQPVDDWGPVDMTPEEIADAIAEADEAERLLYRMANPGDAALRDMLEGERYRSGRLAEPGPS